MEVLAVTTRERPIPLHRADLSLPTGAELLHLTIYDASEGVPYGSILLALGGPEIVRPD